MIGARLKQYRQRCHLSQEALAQAMGLPHTTISKMEHGTRKVMLEEAVRLVTVLGISLADLAGLPAGAPQDDEVQLLAQHYAQKLREAEAAFHELRVMVEQLELALSIRRVPGPPSKE